MTDYFKPREDSATETAPAQAEGPQPRFSMEGINVEEPAAQAAPVADDAAALIADWFDAAAADWSATGTETSAQVSAVSEADRAALDAAVAAEPVAFEFTAVRDGASAPAMLLFSQAAAISTAQAMLGPDVKEVDDAVLEILGQTAARITGSLRGAWAAQGAEGVSTEGGSARRLDAVQDGFAAGGRIARVMMTFGGNAVPFSLVLPAGFDSLLAAAQVQPDAVLAVQDDSGRLARILRIKVPIIVEIAHRKTNVREVIALKPGTVIEFNTKSDDLLGFHIGRARIGKGEAVKIGENFGLRILDIGGVRERIASLKV